MGNGREGPKAELSRFGGHAYFNFGEFELNTNFCLFTFCICLIYNNVNFFCTFFQSFQSKKKKNKLKSQSSEVCYSVILYRLNVCIINSETVVYS